MTAKQRAKIYRQAAENIFWGAGDGFCCGQIAQVANSFGYFYLVAYAEHFPEFFHFEPIVKDRYRACWYYQDEKQSRILALLLSEQMALNPIK